MGYVTTEDVKRVEAHLAAIGMMSEIKHIQPAIGITADKILSLMHKDKKATAKGLTFVLLNKIGRAKLDSNVPEEKVLDVIKGSLT